MSAHKNSLPRWQIFLGTGLIVLSAIWYYIHYLLFHDLHHIFLYLVGDIAFVFVEVLLVTLILHELLAVKEKQTMLRKLNMVIGSFYSEAGVELMRHFARFDPKANEISRQLVIRNEWTRRDFDALARRLEQYDTELDMSRGDLEALKAFLAGRRQFLLVLLENPNLLEHESFSNLLWAVFHLAEELSHRKTMQGLPATDLTHLAGDIKRAYLQLLAEWLAYLRHLKSAYPFLFSLALRTNPFDPEASVIVKS